MTIRNRGLATTAALLSTLLAAGCAAGDDGAGVSVERDSAGVVIVDNRPGLSADTCAILAEPSLEIGVVEGAPEYQLFDVWDASTFPDGRIAVVNRGTAQIRLYDADGRYLSAFGRQGEGPGEFRNIRRVWVRGSDTLVVADRRPWRFQFLTTDGEYIRAVEPRPLYMQSPELSEVLADGTFALARDLDPRNRPEPGSGFTETSLHVVRHDGTGAVLDTIGAYPHTRQGFLVPDYGLWGTPIFEPHARAASDGERFAVGTGRRPEVALLDLDGATRRLVRWSTPDRTVTSTELERYRRDLLARFEDEEMRRRIGEPQVSDDRPVNDRFPAHGAIVVGRTGRLWVERYVRPTWSQRRWWVFAPDGRFTCHAVTPFDRTGRIVEVGGNHMLVIERDELNVEYLRRYEIRVSGGA